MGSCPLQRDLQHRRLSMAGSSDRREQVLASKFVQTVDDSCRTAATQLPASDTSNMPYTRLGLGTATPDLAGSCCWLLLGAAARCCCSVLLLGAAARCCCWLVYTPPEPSLSFLYLCPATNSAQWINLNHSNNNNNKTKATSPRGMA
ncbi:hypothetical protein K440DRAFT_330004 [Wilcoxina mikolae CBS 423.85]|nr:hypothetical protein K440DRAFT_330004 [Wilcoxina mikolae CBS 423.85]